MKAEFPSSVESPNPATPWHCLPVGEVLAQWTTDRQLGLTIDQIVERRLAFGPNRLAAVPRRSALVRLLLQFHNLLIYVLLAAAVTTALLGDYVDTAVIASVVVLNGLIGFIQEGKAEAALDAVRSLLTLSATVIREGRRISVPAEDVVPGDIVALQSGDKVPADVRWVEARSLRIDESILTGESVAVEKTIEPAGLETLIGDRLCMGYSGTLVTYGHGIGVVTAIGANTEIGRISALLAEVDVLATPLLRKIEQFARWLTAIILGAAAATFVFGWLTERLSLDDLFMAAVSLAVAAIPEGLPAIVTITLAVGVQRMARRNAILRKLPAVETLGSVTVICTDKTGTLTRNEMTVQTVITAERELQVAGAGYEPRGEFRDAIGAVDPAGCPDLGELARAALLCNDAVLHQQDGVWRIDGDPTEGALLVLARKAGLDEQHEQRTFPRLDAVPFESEHRFMATLHRDHAGHSMILLKGAPEVVLERCNRQRLAGRDVPIDPELWRRWTAECAARGQRLLTLAMKPAEETQNTLTFADADGGFSLLGMVGMIDPPRPESIDAVARCRRAGIQVKMITGDHAVTACAVAAQLGIGNGERVLTGTDIEQLDDAALAQVAAETDVFARANPEHKLRLVQALRAEGHIVSMTGDGVNDAPALKAADIGVAMGERGTEAAKEASEMVLADDNFATIASAVEEGRTVYENLRKTILFAMPTNGGEAGVIIAAILLGAELPVTPLQILWINLVTAVTLALTLAFETAHGDMMKCPPRSPQEPLVNRYMLWRITYVSLLLVAATMGMYEWELGRGAPVEVARTAAVNALVAGELIYLINSRFILGSSLTLDAWTGNRYALLAMLILIVVQVVFTYAPFMQRAFSSRDIEAAAWLRIGGAACIIFLVVEVEKAVMRWRSPERRLAVVKALVRKAPGRISALPAWVLMMLVAVQWMVTVTRCFTAIDTPSFSAAGFGFSAVLLLLSAALWLEAMGELRSGRIIGASMRVLPPLLLLAAAWHAPDYPFRQDQLPWLVVGATALIATGIAFLALSLLRSGTSRLDGAGNGSDRA